MTAIGLLAALGATSLLAQEGRSPPQEITGDVDKRFNDVDHSEIQIAPEKAPSNPDAGLTDEQRMEKIEQGKSRQEQFLADFVSQGFDPRSLPRATIDASASSPRSLDESADRASVVVVGKVTSVEYQASGEYGPVTSAATVAVSALLKGSAEHTTEVTVTQIGGPVLTPEGPALLQTSTDEVLLPGDKVLLMLVVSSGRNLAIARTGIVFFANGQARTQADSSLENEIGDKSQDEVVRQVKAAIEP